MVVNRTVQEYDELVPKDIVTTVPSSGRLSIARRSPNPLRAREVDIPNLMYKLALAAVQPSLAECEVRAEAQSYHSLQRNALYNARRYIRI